MVSGICYPICGNGFIDGNEEFDDQNQNDQDGCSKECKVEFGYLCSFDTPSRCSPICGDGILRGNE